MRRTRKTKIVATLGPATCTLPSLKLLFEKGADVFRLNFSHGSHENHRQVFNWLRQLESEFKYPITIMMDLQGPKLRIGTFKNSKISLNAGDEFCLDMLREEGDNNRVCFPHPEVFRVLTTGTELLLDDGKLKLKITSQSNNFIKALVLTGGELSNNKGVNIPNAVLPISALTEKDKIDLDFGLGLGVDWVALSFVQSPEDILAAKDIIGTRAKILAKLEKPLAIKYLDEIINVADGVMVARGDLGVEVPPEEVPSLQKKIIRACRQAGKPVVIATQMLDSMINSPIPTRAETSDVATAVYDGADAVMLSAETASGSYPFEAVAIMDKIIFKTEQDPLYPQIINSGREKPRHTIADSITASARHIADIIDIPVIVTFSETGSTTLRAARERPNSPILALTPNLNIARFLGLTWGVYAVLIPPAVDFATMINAACEIANQKKFASPGQRIIITAGTPFGGSGGTNTIKIAEIQNITILQ